jgi:hypothetical protein
MPPSAERTVSLGAKVTATPGSPSRDLETNGSDLGGRLNTARRVRRSPHRWVEKLADHPASVGVSCPNAGMKPPGPQIQGMEYCMQLQRVEP